jgi:hypothetical protein
VTSGIPATAEAATGVGGDVPFTGSRSRLGSRRTKRRGIPRGVGRTLEEAWPKPCSDSLAARMAFAANPLGLTRCRADLQGFKESECRYCLDVRFSRRALPLDLALTLRDSLTSRDASPHPPVVGFIRVNVLPPTCRRWPLSRQGFHPLARAVGATRLPLPSSWFRTTSTA